MDPAAVSRTPDLDRLRRGGKAALSSLLADIERRPDDPAIVALLDTAWQAPSAHVIGVTGPPGVGKSTLLGVMIGTLRAAGRTVAVIAVDPSSRRSGGALLGDRIRLASDPHDAGVFIRSMAARDRLGGLAELTVAAMVAMRAVFDVVLIETVGVGQSETDIARVVDTVVFCVQPGSGDSLQFMKAGIVEVPHLVAVTKADLGAAATRARADVIGALGLAEAGPSDWPVEVLSVSATRGDGIDALFAAIDAHRRWLEEQGRLAAQRRLQGEAWLNEAVRDRFGREGVRRAGRLRLAPGESPFARLAGISRDLLP